MKKILIGLLSIFSMFTLINKTYSYDTTDKDVIYFEDGSYLVIELRVYEVPRLMSTTSAISYNISGTKNVTMYDKNNKYLWNYHLDGSFQVTEGVIAVATSSAFAVTNDSDSWHFSDGSSYTVANRVEGRGKFQHKVWFIVVDTVNIDVNLVCDVNGNIV